MPRQEALLPAQLHYLVVLGLATPEAVAQAVAAVAGQRLAKHRLRPVTLDD